MADNPKKHTKWLHREGGEGHPSAGAQGDPRGRPKPRKGHGIFGQELASAPQRLLRGCRTVEFFVPRNGGQRFVTFRLSVRFVGRPNKRRQ